VGTVYRKTGGTTARPILKPIATGLPRPPGPIARPMVPPMGPGGLPPWSSLPPLRRQRIARMIRRHKWMHARGYAFAGSIDATSGRYVPDASEILTAAPKPGSFYVPRSGIYPAKVADVAYGAADRKRGLLAMNASTWNDHVRRAAAGWEPYKVKGLQFEAKYKATDPRSTYGSGNAFPVIWVPPLDGREPEAFFSTGPVVPPVGPVVPPYVPPTPPVGPVVPPYVPPTPPDVPPYVPPTPPDVPPYVPPVVPILPPVPPIEPPPVPPYVPPPPGPSGEAGGLGSVVVGLSILSAIARLIQR
jgi:hypothetical protein